MIPEVYLVLKILLIAICVYAICMWFGVVFQSVLFQRYRLHKNEAAKRKARLHEEDIGNERYRTELLGAVTEEKEGAGNQ